jgi:hypothetical protein
VPDEFDLVGATCTTRTAGFTCSASETGDGRIVLSLDGQGSACINPGAGAIARVCLHDAAPVCPVVSLVSLNASDVTATDCAAQPLAICPQSGGIICEVLGDCAVDNGVIDIFDVLNTIDIILQKVAPTSVETIVCDDNCDGVINIFDVLQEIDAILGRISQPLTCAQALSLTPATTTESAAPARAGNATAKRASSEPSVSLRQNGRAVILANRRTPVRGLELTLEPAGGPVEVVGVRATRRARGFVVGYHQADFEAPVKIVVLSLAGEALQPGRGTIATLKLRGARRHGRLRLTGVRVAQ